MKRIIFLITLLCSLSAKSQQSQKMFFVKGLITGARTTILRLSYTGDDGKLRKDSAVIKDGKFSFEGALQLPTMAYISGNTKSRSDEDPNTTSFFLEPAVIHIALKEDEFKKAVITGSNSQSEMAVLEQSLAPVLSDMQGLSEKYTRANETYIKAKEDKLPDSVLNVMHENLASIREGFDPFRQRIAVLNYSFFHSHPQSYVTAYNLRFYTGSLPLDSLEMFYNKLGTFVQQSNLGKLISREIQQLQAGAIGSKARNFVTTDLLNNKLSLSAFRGKYVLLDFWASWCVPCRKGSPHLRQLYSQYHSQGLEIIGIADDDNKLAEWKKAIAADSVSVWHHVLRGFDITKMQKGEDNPKDISNMFGVQSLPTKILLDASGVIVGRYDKNSPEEMLAMDKKIASLMMK